jgi:hypothetical protein
MRRVTAASLAGTAPAARPAAAIAKEGDITDLFDEPLPPIPACVLPAAAAPPPVPNFVAPAAVAAVPPPPLGPAEAPGPAAWRERLIARFFRAPREEQSEPNPRVDRLQQMRRLGLD